MTVTQFKRVALPLFHSVIRVVPSFVTEYTSSLSKSVTDPATQTYLSLVSAAPIHRVFDFSDACEAVGMWHAIFGHTKAIQSSISDLKVLDYFYHLMKEVHVHSHHTPFNNKNSPHILLSSGFSQSLVADDKTELSAQSLAHSFHFFEVSHSKKGLLSFYPSDRSSGHTIGFQALPYSRFTLSTHRTFTFFDLEYSANPYPEKIGTIKKNSHDSFNDSQRPGELLKLVSWSVSSRSLNSFLLDFASYLGEKFKSSCSRYLLRLLLENPHKVSAHAHCERDALEKYIQATRTIHP